MTPAELSPQVRQSLSLIWKEGIPAHIMLAVFDYFLVPYALFLNITPFRVGLMIAFPHLMGSLSQLGAVRLIQWAKTRVRFLVLGTLIQAMVIMGIAFIIYAPESAQFELLLTGVCLFRILMGLISTAWGSLVSDYLPPQKRGHYLGWRSQIVGIAGLGGTAISGLLLFSVKHVSETAAFFLLFLFAAACRALSSRFMSRLHEITYHAPPESHFTFFNFIRQFRKSNFVKFVLFTSGMMMATYISAPYYSVYLLSELHLSYLNYMLVHFSGIFAGLISLPIWGKHADITGNARLLKLTGLLVSFIPFCLLFSRQIAYLAIIEFFSGFVWGAFNLCAITFIFDAVSPAKRARCLGYFSLIHGIGIFIGTLLGGYLFEAAPLILGSPFYPLFLISAAARLVVSLTLGNAFQEIRKVSPVTQRQLFASVVGIRPLAGLARGWNVFPEYEQKPKIE